MLEELEALTVDEVLGELVSLNHIHQAVGKRNFGKHCDFRVFHALGLCDEDVLLLKQKDHKVLGGLSALLVFVSFDEHGQGVGGQIAVVLLVHFVALD